MVIYGRFLKSVKIVSQREMILIILVFGISVEENYKEI
jgi:hypothetical protein